MADIRLMPNDAITSEDAETVRRMILGDIKRGEVVNLNFAMAGTVTYHWMNIAVASLLTEVSSEALNAHLFFHGMSVQQMDTLARMIKYQKEIARG